jgi:hypothetical protein
MAFHLSLKRMPDGAVEIEAGEETRIFTASQWCAIIAALAKKDIEKDGIREWIRAQDFHRVRCFGPMPVITEVPD